MVDSSTEYGKSIRGDQWIPRSDYPVTPDHIDFGRINNLFGRNETDSASRAIVKGCQQRGEGWAPFTLKDMNLAADPPGQSIKELEVCHPGLIDLLERELVRGWEGRASVGQEDTFMVSHVFVALLFANAPSCNAVSTTQDGD